MKRIALTLSILGTRSLLTSSCSRASEKYFATTKARFVKVTLTGAQPGKPWSICELELVAAKPGDAAR